MRVGRAVLRSVEVERGQPGPCMSWNGFAAPQWLINTWCPPRVAAGMVLIQQRVGTAALKVALQLVLSCGCI